MKMPKNSYKLWKESEMTKLRALATGNTPTRILRYY